MKRTTLWFLVLLIVVFGLILWAAYQSFFGLFLNYEIRPVELAILAVNVFIAFFLQYYLATRITDQRTEKNILIDGLREVLVNLRQCRESVSNSYHSGRLAQPASKLILSLLRKVSNDLDTLETSLNASECSALGKECEAIRDMLFKYKGATTDGGFPAKAYTNDGFLEQERAYKKLAQQLQTLMFKINQYH
jgi:hypothetical protein